jgi:3-hydroxybutyryl-CoA dehydrogenase
METPKNIAVLGAGTMGHGIAQVAAQAGFRVALHDVSEEAVMKGLAAIGANLQKAVGKGRLTEAEKAEALARVSACASFEDAVREADIVIEAAPEKIALKQEIFGRLAARAPKDCVLATNTSSLSVSDIANATTCPERVVGMHFFNPPAVLKLLEIVTTPYTAPDVLERAKEAALRMERDVIVVRDSPGFATSRLGVALGLEAMRMLEEGVASAEDIDRAMELGYRHPMGPLKLTDLVGLDTRLSIAEYLHEKLGGERFRPPEILRRLVKEGRLGKKTGQGFYKY